MLVCRVPAGAFLDKSVAEKNKLRALEASHADMNSEGSTYFIPLPLVLRLLHVLQTQV